jgi:hypothetical protein
VYNDWYCEKLCGIIIYYILIVSLKNNNNFFKKKTKLKLNFFKTKNDEGGGFNLGVAEVRGDYAATPSCWGWRAATPKGV